MFLPHNNNSIYFTLAILKHPFCGKIHLFHLKASDLFNGVLFIYFVSNDLFVFPLISLTNRFFCAGTIVLLAWKPLSYPPLFPYQFSRLLLLPRTLSNILHFHGRYGMVFPPLSSTVDSRQLKTSGKSRSKVNGTTFASRKLSRPPPAPKFPHISASPV